MTPRQPVEAGTFREALGRFASGITVLTTRDAAGGDHGMTVSAFSSLSLDPPLVLACIGHDATIAAAVRAAEYTGISVLAEEQQEISRRFADSDTDRFAGIPLVRGAGGVALLEGALAHLECRIVARHENGDHTIVVAEVLAASARMGRPLLHFGRQYGRFVP